MKAFLSGFGSRNKFISNIRTAIAYCQAYACVAQVTVAINICISELHPFGISALCITSEGVAIRGCRS
jgi:hypothetical protein